jgi:hypothetical protein
LALTPTDNQAFVREVDEDLRRDQIGGVVRRWGKLIAIAVAVGLIALAAFLYWQHRRAEQAGAEGEQLTTLLDEAAAGRAGANDPRLATLAQSSRTGTQAMARMLQAALAARTDPTAGAASFQAIADDADLPQAVRDVAAIRGTTLQFDRLPPQQVVDRLKGLAVPGNPWFGSAGELTGLAQLKLNRPDLAGPLFAKIAADATVPATLRGRAAAMASALGQDVVLPAADEGAAR